jgi:phosphotransferase system enzyme I (PtsI)
LVSNELLAGVSAAPGVAIGPALVYKPEVTPAAPPGGRVADNPEAERRRFQEASEAVAAALSELMAQADDQAKAILEAHLMMLQDPSLIEQVEAGITAGRPAEAAVESAVGEFAGMLAALDDPYLKERAADVRDVGRRLMAALAGKPAGLRLERPCIVVAHELGPSDTIGLDRSLLLGLVTEQGGPTSHTSILARTWAIPAVVLPGITGRVATGDTIALDGDAGNLQLNPAAEALAAYEQRARQASAQAERDLAEAELVAETTDGHRVELAANAGRPGDVAPAVALGAQGVGLFRSEFLFMGRQTAPDEDEQYAAYAEALKAAAGHRVVIRTMDIGGDKAVDYLNMEKEENPFLGVRALRLCFRRPGLFRTQLRALLRAGVHGKLAIMFPMVGSLGDLRSARRELDDARRSLEADGITHVSHPEVGIMVEIPAAALIAPHLAQEVDFFSIGTNDLVQYTLAVDRGNPELADLYQPYHPAVLRLIDQVVVAAHAAGKWVGVCGEMGGQPIGSLLLTGLGVDELSMSPSRLPKVRRLIRSNRFAELERIAREALTLGTPDYVTQLVAPLVK